MNIIEKFIEYAVAEYSATMEENDDYIILKFKKKDNFLKVVSEKEDIPPTILRASLEVLNNLNTSLCYMLVKHLLEKHFSISKNTLDEKTTNIMQKISDRSI